MNRNIAIISGGLLIVTIVTSATVFFSNEFSLPDIFLKKTGVTIKICNCKENNIGFDEIEKLSKSFLLQQKHKGATIIIPVLENNKHESFVVPSYGVSWLTMNWFPATYRFQYRIQDEESYWKNSNNKVNLSAFLSEINNNKDCVDLADSKHSINIDLSLPDSSEVSNNYSSARDEFEDMLISGDINVGDVIMLKIGCDPNLVYGCMNPKACNYSSLATIDGECILPDECGKCDGDKSGPGKIYTCGCRERPAGDCDCNGNKLNRIGICGGVKLDVVHSGMHFIFKGAASTQNFEIRYAVTTSNGIIKRGVAKDKSKFPFNKAESDMFMSNIGKSNVADLEIKFTFYQGEKSLLSKDFKGFDYICINPHKCGFQKSPKIFKTESE